jgi:hypothetical protein
MLARQQLQCNRGTACFMPSVPRCYNQKQLARYPDNPCGGKVEYLHRSPASRRRRQNGKSRIWDSKIWSRVPRDPESRMTVLARTSSNFKRQTRPFIWESAPYQQTRNCLTVIKSGRKPHTDRLTVGRNIRLRESWVRERDSESVESEVCPVAFFRVVQASRASSSSWVQS